MDLGNKGIELDVYDTKGNGKKHLGDLHIGRGGITWCNGKTNKDNGSKVSWNELISCNEKRTK